LGIFVRRENDQISPGASAQRREPVLLRLISLLALLTVGAIVVCIGLGLVLARQADDYLDAEHRQSLRGAIEALQAVSPDLSRVEPKLINILERASGLRDLKFAADPPEGAGYAVQSLIGRNGRIVGWFSWRPERPATAMMMRLLPFAVLIVLALFGFAGLAMRQLRRLDYQLRNSERQMLRLASEDTTTGLPNQAQLMELLDQAIAGRAADEMLAFAILDLDGFEEMNHSLGEEACNEIMVAMTERLRQALPSDAILGRITPRKFAWLVRVTDPELALAVAESARDAVSRAMWVNQMVQLGAGVGITFVPRDGVVSKDLLRRSRLALRAARRHGRGAIATFAAELEVDFDERQFIRQELTRALAARCFEVRYQPIVKAEGSTIVGVEALLRWNHVSRGAIPPSVFIGVAEEAGLMNQLGELVLRKALADAARWPDLYVAVNLSPVQVRDRRFVELIASVLAESNIAPSRVVLEITENVLIDDPDTAKSRLQDLRKLGVRLALDDFGSGYSSLTYLQRLPFDKLKIDRAFVEALDHSANAGVIIQAIISLGRALGLTVLIEGVETEEQRVLLRLAGCNEMQGYLFAMPAPPEEIDRLLTGGGLVSTGERASA
jgi:diguanylate cyclase (GGDEF)-like protein